MVASRRTTRSARSSRGGTSSRKKNAGAGGGGGLSVSSRTVRKWVQVRRPPAPGVGFDRMIWVATDELTQEEREKFFPHLIETKPTENEAGQAAASSGDAVAGSADAAANLTAHAAPLSNTTAVLPSSSDTAVPTSTTELSDSFTQAHYPPMPGGGGASAATLTADSPFDWSGPKTPSAVPPPAPPAAPALPISVTAPAVAEPSPAVSAATHPLTTSNPPSSVNPRQPTDPATTAAAPPASTTTTAPVAESGSEPSYEPTPKKARTEVPFDSPPWREF